jgi:hypothetical protein
MRSMRNPAPLEHIHSKIRLLRSRDVILDDDLAELIGIAADDLVAMVRRHADRFPADFVYELSEGELDCLGRRGDDPPGAGTAYRPCRVLAFTKQGVGMLLSVLTSDEAVFACMDVMRAFAQAEDVFDMVLALGAGTDQPQ